MKWDVGTFGPFRPFPTQHAEVEQRCQPQRQLKVITRTISFTLQAPQQCSHRISSMISSAGTGMSLGLACPSAA
jgi:hypothetical protein